MATPTDLDLLDAFRRRADQQAFAALVERHGSWVYGLCLRVTGRAAEADEACQDAFLELARGANRVRERVPAWLHTVARRCAARIIARRPLTTALPDDVPALQAQRADLAHLDEALAELDVDLRAVLVARFLAGQSQDAIAAGLAISQATVSRRLAEGLARMRAALDRRGVALGAAPAALFEQLPAAALPAPMVDVLGRVALVARAAPIAWAIPVLPLILLASALVAALALWTARPRHAPTPTAVVADEPPAPAPVPGLDASHGWSLVLRHVEASAIDMRRAVGASRVLTAINGRPIGHFGWSDAAGDAFGGPMVLDLLDAAAVARRCGPFPPASLNGAYAWDPRVGVPPGAWDDAVAEASATWLDRPEAALAALDRAIDAGCPRVALAMLGTACASAAGRDDACAAWHADVPAGRGDRWFADAALHAALRARGAIERARVLSEGLAMSLGRLPAGLADAEPPSWPADWSSIAAAFEDPDLGESLASGSAHIWNGDGVSLRSEPLTGPIAVSIRGDAFTALPGLARPYARVMVALEPVGGGASPGDHVGWLLHNGGAQCVLDGTGAQVPSLRPDDGAIELRLLADGTTCAVWVDGRLHAVAPQRHQGQWRLVISAQTSDVYLPQVLVLRPDARPGDDLWSAIRDDDADAVRRRLAAGDDPTEPFPGSRLSPLAVAAVGDRCRAIAALLDDPRVRIDAVDATGGTALYRAIDNHALAAAKLLLERGAPASPVNRYGTTPLGYACRAAHLPLIDLLLAHGAAIADESRHGAPGGAAIDLLGPGPNAAGVVALFRRHGKPITARAQALGGDPAGAAAALADDARREAEGPGLLAAAVLLDDAALVRRCLEAGVPIGARDPGTLMTALQLAVGITGNPDIAQELAARGADLDAGDVGSTARDLARTTGFPLEILVPAAAQPQEGDDF
ncbi:MAG TPA: sigma-70 family RNA polymerase sigma factor [Planctomycetota bacterium]|nr:sigma-70 family RNA polymerase sigma factor [Planctomycetota bacterium]